VPAAGPSRRSQRQRRNQAEEALLDAAARLFARRGVDRTSLADISQEAGYSPRLITHHFGSKAALVDRLIRRNLHEFLFVADASDAGHELDALVAVLEAYFAWMTRNEEARAYFVLCSAGLTEDAELRPVFVSIDATFRTGLQTIVRAGQRSQSISSDVDAEGVATALVGMMRGIGTQFLVNPDTVDLDTAQEVCKQFIWHTLAPRPAP
jgi:AcrR family transcriptional regulator